MIYAENILLCIAVPLLISLLFLRGKTRRFVLNFLAGMVLCLLAAYISGYLQQASGLDANDAAIFLSPIVEELMKLLPVLEQQRKGSGSPPQQQRFLFHGSLCPFRFFRSVYAAKGRFMIDSISRSTAAPLWKAPAGERG